jgi:hypothetical protein
MQVKRGWWMRRPNTDVPSRPGKLQACRLHRPRAAWRHAVLFLTQPEEP